MYFGCFFFNVKDYKHDVTPQLARAGGGKGCGNLGDELGGVFHSYLLCPLMYD